MPSLPRLSRPLGIALLVVMLPGLAGCGFLFTKAPPDNYQQMNSFNCTESDAAPVLDVVWGSLNVLGALAAASDPYAYENPDQIVAIGLGWGVVSTASAITGFNNTKKCRNARAEAAARNPIAAPAAAQPPLGVDPVLVEITPAVDTLRVGERVQLVASAHESSGTLLPGRSYTWTSSNDAIASVNAAGNVFANAAGSVVIAARTGSVVGTAKIVVLGQ